MYQILSVQLPARDSVTDEMVVEELVRWVAQSQHYDFRQEDLVEMLSGRQVARSYDEILGKRAALRFCRMTLNGDHYIEMRLENPDEEHNFLWRAECVFRRPAEGNREAVFQVTLGREPLEAGRSVDLNVAPRIPYIAKLLRRRGRLAKELSVENAAWPGLPERFPVVICGASDRFTGGAELVRHLKNGLGPIAQVTTRERASLRLEGAEALGEGEVLVVYPAAQIRRVYSHVTLPGGAAFHREAADRILVDVMRWVSEVHAETAFSWREAPEEPPRISSPVQGNYCTLNRAMGSYLRALRRQNGLSQQELAAKVGTTGLIISRLETVRLQRVSRELLREIEQVLGVEAGTISAIQEHPAPEAPAPVLEAERNVPEKEGFCRRCGLHLYQDSLFCPQCGTRVLR